MRDDDVVALMVPADSSYFAVLRTATAGLAARLEFTLDEIEDLRIAVDEACALLLAVAPGDAELTCEFRITAPALMIEITTPLTPGAALPSTQSFSWQVLTALAGEVSSLSAADHASIKLTKQRTPGQHGPSGP